MFPSWRTIYFLLVLRFTQVMVALIWAIIQQTWVRHYILIDKWWLGLNTYKRMMVCCFVVTVCSYAQAYTTQHEAVYGSKNLTILPGLRVVCWQAHVSREHLFVYLNTAHDSTPAFHLPDCLFCCPHNMLLTLPSNTFTHRIWSEQIPKGVTAIPARLSALWH